VVKVEATLLAQATGIEHCLAVAVRACPRGLLRLGGHKTNLLLLAPTFKTTGVVAPILEQQLDQQLRQTLCLMEVKWVEVEAE
jgi:hypothetical protein